MRRISFLALATLSVAALPAQGFENYETPIVKGITVASVGGNTWIAAVNPDDNSVSFINAATDTLVQRVAVGLGPCSIFYDAPLQRLYTANHLGDSVSVLSLSGPATAPAQLLTTQWVGDEPTDLAVRHPAGQGPQLWVLLASTSRIARFHPATLAPVSNSWGTNDVPVLGTFSPARIMKYPYRLIIQNDTAYILNLRGRTNHYFGSNSPDNLELVKWDFGISIEPVSNTMGTSHMGMAVASNGRAYVVGNNARNDILGEPQLRSLPQGFVESHFYSYGGPGTTTGTKDLNKAATPTTSVSMPTDVAIIEQGGVVERSFVPSFSNDRIIEFVRGTNNDIIDGATTVRQLTQRTGYEMVGPRSLVVTRVAGQIKLYVLCRLDAAVRVFDVTTVGGTTGATATIALNDPFPRRLRAGQRLLYDARLSDNGNGIGMVSCASCHIDGKTDGLIWDLDTGSINSGGPNPVPVPADLVDGITAGIYNENRGPMATQTLQGLRTHTARNWDPTDDHSVLSTKPFYWRGGRMTFLSFGPAFNALLGLPLANMTTAMQDYRDYAFTIMYPPNPEQPLDRVYSGGSPSAGARLGLAQFLNTPLDPLGTGTLNEIPVGDLTGGRSCVQCHALPSGTNGLLTELRGTSGVPGLSNPIKSAQLRGIRNRERRHVPFFMMNPYGTNAPMHAHGAFHDGSLDTINDLITNQFHPPSIPTMADMIAFVREWDSGAAPIIGRSLTFDAAIMAEWAAILGSPANALNGAVAGVTFSLVQAARANCDVVVDYQVSGTTLSLYYDVQRGGFVDPTLPQGTGTLWTLTNANPLLTTTYPPGSRVVFQAVPVGSGRRIATPSGQAVVQSNPAPTAVASIAMVVPDPWRDVTANSGNLANFVWQNDPAPSPIEVSGMEKLQNALSAASMLPLPAPYHEAPRRFRVTGTGIRPGAKLRLALPTAWTGTTPATFDGGITMELFPVRENGAIYWETSATLRPKVMYAIANGWFSAPGVAAAFGQNPLGTTPAAGPLNPTAFNQVQFRVSNENAAANPPTILEPGVQFVGPLVIQ